MKNKVATTEKTYPKAFFELETVEVEGVVSSLAILVVCKVFLKAVTVAMDPLWLMSTLTVHASEASSTPRILSPVRVRHLNRVVEA